MWYALHSPAFFGSKQNTCSRRSACCSIVYLRAIAFPQAPSEDLPQEPGLVWQKAGLDFKRRSSYSTRAEVRCTPATTTDVLCIACLHWRAHISTRCAGARGEGKAIDRRLAGLDVCVGELHSGEPRCASLGALAFWWLDVQVMHEHEFGPCTTRH